MAEKQNYGIQNEQHVQQSVAGFVFLDGWGHGRGESGRALALSRACRSTRRCA
jgi:hypothetical protein